MFFLFFYLNLGDLSGTVLGYVPGLYAGCYIVDTFLQSTLELLFDQNNINHLLQLIFKTGSITNKIYPALNTTKLQNFTVTTSGNDLVARLFVDVWIKTYSHESYFLSCHPTQCSYSFLGKHSFIVTVTLVLGLIGGLNSILRLTIPLFIHIIFFIQEKYINCKRNPSSVENRKLS